MFEELVKRLRNFSGTDNIAEFAEAADAIEGLSMRLHGDEAAIAGMKREIERMVVSGNKPRWIPVTERLPEKYHQVLVYGINGLQIDYYAGEKSIGGFPLFMISEAKVTHWMQLPTPPKEVDND